MRPHRGPNDCAPEAGVLLRDRSEPTDLVALVPQLGLQFEPQLAQLDRLLDDDDLCVPVRADLARRRPRTRSHGRPSTPVEVFLRMLIVMRLSGWSLERTEYFVNDSLVLRQFCRVSLEKVPDDTTLIRRAQLVGPETLQRLNDRGVPRAQAERVTRGRQLRVDTTAVETAIHYPTDSGLIGDGVRVRSRRLRRAQAALGAAAVGLGGAFRGRVRAVRTLARQRHRSARRQGEQGRVALKDAHGRRIAVARRAGAQAGRVLETLRKQAEEPTARRLAERRGAFPPRREQGLDQASRRVLKGESVPAREKLLSWFEPHTQIIPRFTAGKAVECGRKIRRDEVEGGIITGHALLEQGGGQDQPCLKDGLAAHRRHFGRAPDLLAADRGLASAENERLAREAGVKHVAWPQVGQASPQRKVLEKGRRFRRGDRFRAGLEGRIHVPRRDRGLRRCRHHGEGGRGRWVGGGIVTHNLTKVAEAGAAR